MGVGLLASSLILIGALRFPEYQSDFDQVWFAARALLQGRDPYALIGPGREFDAAFALYYPLPAPLVVAPLGLLSPVAARIVFMGLTSGLLAFLVTRDGYDRLPIFASGAFISCVQLVQWTPLVACALLLPALGFMATGKPNIGIAAFTGARTWRGLGLALAGAALVTATTFLIQPDWLGRWRTEVSTAAHFRSYLLVPGGQLLALCALRWRRWDARILATLALVPQTPGGNATLLLLLTPERRREVLVFAILTYIPLFVGLRAAHMPTFEQYADVMALATLYGVLLPALLFILRQPNEGPVPAWLERLASRLPPWLSGRPGPAAPAAQAGS